MWCYRRFRNFGETIGAGFTRGGDTRGFENISRRRYTEYGLSSYARGWLNVGSGADTRVNPAT